MKVTTDQRFRFILGILFSFLVMARLDAEVSPYPGLSVFTLDNGLELFVYEDHELPLARIQLSFRAGASIQNPETAGYFHLLEHLLFRGTGREKDTNEALAELGASEWNGGTSAEYLSFWLSLPAAKAEEAISFWARLVSVDGFSPEEVETEKTVVLRELDERNREPASIYEAALTRRLFSKYPWRRDPAGSEKAIRTASAESLGALKKTWLVPNNAALFIGGDVDPAAVYAEVAEAFSSWAPGPDPRAGSRPSHPKIGVTRPTFLVYPDASLPEGLASVEIRYRGPDIATDPQGSYAADLWSALVASPEGRFKRAIMKAVPGLHGTDPVKAYYISQREGGILSISATLDVQATLSSVERTWAFKEAVRGSEINAMKTNPAYFSPADYDEARKTLLETRQRSLDTADEFISDLAFWWASASFDYFLGWPQAIEAVDQRELASLLDTYVLKNLEVVALRLSPADYDREKKTLVANGFETIAPTNAFWWQ